MASPPTSTRAGAALGSLVLGYLLIALIAGAPDSPLVPPLPAGVRPPGWTATGARWIGLDRLTRTGLTVMAILALAAIVILFFFVLAQARRGRVRSRMILAAVALSLAFSVAAPLMLSRDVFSYAAYGRIYAVHHANPYVRLPSDYPADPFVRVASPAWIDTPAVYGPGFVLASAGVARAASGSPGLTILIFKLLAGVGAALATGLVAVAARPIPPMGHQPGEGDRAKPTVAAAAVGLNPVIVIHTVGGGHNDALIAACLAGALVLGLHWMKGESLPRRAVGPVPFAVTALLTLAGLIKVVLFPVLLIWLWHLLRSTAPRRRMTGVMVHVVEAAALSVAFAGPFLNSARAFTSLVTLTSVEGWASPARLVARGARAVGHAIGGTVTADALDKVVILGFLAVFASVFIRFFRRQGQGGRSRTGEGLAGAWAVGTLGFALAIPYLLPWYAAWFLPFVALMTDTGIWTIGLAAAGLLALTGVPAEPGTAPGVWHDMVLGVHYGIAPIMLVLFLAWAGRSLGAKLAGHGVVDATPRMTDRARP
jgi:alpha-1,6-mannosyltransferase